MFKFKLITPTKTLLDDEVFMCVLPGEEGVFGILENHAPMIVSLKKGRIDLYKTNSEIFKKFDIEKGYAQIKRDGCFVYTEQGESVE